MFSTNFDHEKKWSGRLYVPGAESGVDKVKKPCRSAAFFRNEQHQSTLGLPTRMTVEQKTELTLEGSLGVFMCGKQGFCCSSSERFEVTSRHEQACKGCVCVAKAPV